MMVFGILLWLFPCFQESRLQTPNNKNKLWSTTTGCKPDSCCSGTVGVLNRASESGRVAIVFHTMPNKGLELTAYSVHSSLALASSSSSGPAFSRTQAADGMQTGMKGAVPARSDGEKWVSGRLNRVRAWARSAAAAGS
jgi:hypothetical protein